MSIELKNRLEVDFGIAVLMTDFLKGPSIAELADSLVVRLRSGEFTAPAPIRRQRTPEQTLANIEHLTDTEVDTMLSSLLQAKTT